MIKFTSWKFFYPFLGKHGAALQASLNDLSADRLLEHLPPDNKQLFRDRVKTVTERAALLKITSNAMVKASTDFVQVTPKFPAPNTVVNGRHPFSEACLQDCQTVIQSCV